MVCNPPKPSNIRLIKIRFTQRTCRVDPRGAQKKAPGNLAKNQKAAIESAAQKMDQIKVRACKGGIVPQQPQQVFSHFHELASGP